MDFKKFIDELHTKRRTVQDLIRFISTRTDQNPNYTLLTGAGCSISSGVRSAYHLVELWRRDLYEFFAREQAIAGAQISEQREFLKANQGGWYDPSREYSSLFEKKYDLQRQRRMFVEMEVSNKTPSIGYAYLTALVEQNFFNTIFTTNFDDLLNEAFYTYSEQRPIVCAHDSSINSITVTSKRPKIVKLHGDYLFDDLKCTQRETETLEQNMKAKFAEFSKDYGLIVVGYSGGDRSIMDVISTLLKNEEYFKNGVYWCIREGTEISEDLRKLMWRERVYFVVIDGFDELFAELYCNLNDGDVLPTAALSVGRKPTDVVQKLLRSGGSFPAGSAVLQKAKERLERQSKRTTLVNLIVKPDNEAANGSLASPDLSDDDLILLTEIQNMISDDHCEQAIEKARSSLQAGVTLSVRLRLLRLIIQAHQMCGQLSQALLVADELINLQPKNSAHHLRKATILRKRPDRLNCIEEAIAIDPYSVDSYLDKASLLASWAAGAYGQARLDLLSKASDALEQGIVLDPNWRNPCWQKRFDLIQLQENNREKRRSTQEAIIGQLQKQNPFSIRVLTMREKMLSDKDKSEVHEELMSDISEALARSNLNMAHRLELLKLKTLAKLGDARRLRDAIDLVVASPESKNADLVVGVAAILRKSFGSDEEAVRILQEYMRYDFDVDVVVALLHIHADVKDHAEADRLFNKWQRRLSASLRHDLKIVLYDARGQYEESLLEIKRYEEETGGNDPSHAIYLNLKLGKYDVAERMARSVLAPILYSAEAATEIVNLEFARKKQGDKVDVSRLKAVLAFSAPSETSAAVNALLENKAGMLEEIKQAMRENKTFRYRAADWPIFDACRSDPAFKEALAV